MSTNVLDMISQIRHNLIMSSGTHMPTVDTRQPMDASWADSTLIPEEREKTNATTEKTLKV